MPFRILASSAFARVRSYSPRTPVQSLAPCSVLGAA